MFTKPALSALRWQTQIQRAKDFSTEEEQQPRELEMQLRTTLSTCSEERRQIRRALHVMRRFDNVISGTDRLSRLLFAEI